VTDREQSPEGLDGWTLDARIGAGGLADVWRAHGADGRLVALKVLREPDRSPAHRSRFLREGRLLHRLDHPGLPRCFGVGDGPQPYLILELLTGETVSARLKRAGALDPEQVTALAGSLLRVLDYLHQKGIVHRDVKSSNVFLAEDRRVLLLDLGLAADPQDPLTTTLGDVMGTYAYMAPEQIAGAEVDHRADLYSLGVSLYEALSGKRPFHARGAAGYLRAHREAGAPPLSRLCPEAPVRLVDLITRLMARDPLVRPASAAIAWALLTGATGARRSLAPAPLVGRSAAAGAVAGVLDGGGAVMLVGEIGAGVGRMASFALTLARRERVETIALRCRGRANPLDPIEQLARDLARISGPVAPQVEALAAATAALVGEGPLLLLIEDTENLAPEAEAMLAAIIARAPGLSVVLTGLRPVIGIPAHRVILRGINAEESQVLVAGMLGTSSPPAGLAAQLHDMAGGLPAIVVLAVKELVGRGALWCEGVADDGVVRWRLDRNVPIEPTMGLMRLFGSLIGQLPEGARALLDVLAVAGEALPIELALRIAGDDGSGLALGPLDQTRLIAIERHEDGDWVMLRRPAVGTLVVGAIPALAQQQLHAALADALQELPSWPWRDQRLTWHAAHGADAAHAPEALLRLGEALHRRGLHARALEVLDRVSRSAEVDVQVAALLAVARGEALEAIARRAEANTTLLAARRLAEELGDEGLLARVMVASAQVHHGMGDERRAAQLAEEALSLLRDRPADPALPAALLIAATSHRMGARPEHATALLRRCAEVAQAQGRPEYAAMAEGGLGSLLAEEGLLRDAVAHMGREVAYLRVQGPARRLAPTLYRLSVVQRRLGRIQDALLLLDEAEEVACFAQLPYERALARIGRAGVHLAVGDFEGTAALLKAARVALDPDASTFHRIQFREVQAHMRLLAGDRQAALAVFQAAEVEATRAGLASAAAFFLGMVGVLTADGDAITDAMEVLGSAGDRRLAARLLLYGGTVGGDAEILESAEREARASGDVFLLLEVLHASGTAAHQEEARALAGAIVQDVPPALIDAFLGLPAIKWCGLPTLPGQRKR
jgi:tetratricopeptide (TPR) repeat protein